MPGEGFSVEGANRRASRSTCSCGATERRAQSSSSAQLSLLSAAGIGNERAASNRSSDLSLRAVPRAVQVAEKNPLNVLSKTTVPIDRQYRRDPIA